MVTTFYPPYNFGGDGIFVHQLSNELASNGHAVEVVHCPDAYRLLSGDKSVLPYKDHPGITIHEIKSRLRLLSMAAIHQTGHPLFYLKKIHAVLKKEFDVIHFHNISLIGGPSILGAGKGIKLMTIHDYWLLCQNHTLLKFNKNICRKPDCFFCSITQKRPIQLWRYSGLLKRKIKNIDMFLAPSRFIRKVHQSRGISAPMTYLPNFRLSEIGANRPDMTDLGIGKKGKPYFLFAGRLEINKGVQAIIPVFKKYREASLLIAGKGSCENRLRKLAGDDVNIHFLGNQSQTQLSALYAGSVALIVPSLWYENFPLVILEAFGCGTPVIVRNIGALPEIITQSRGGLLFNTDKDLIDCLNLLLTNPPFTRKLAVNARRAYEKDWSVKAHLEKYLDLIKKLLQERKKDQRAPSIQKAYDFNRENRLTKNRDNLLK